MYILQISALCSSFQFLFLLLNKSYELFYLIFSFPVVHIIKPLHVPVEYLQLFLWYLVREKYTSLCISYLPNQGLCIALKEPALLFSLIILVWAFNYSLPTFP